MGLNESFILSDPEIFILYHCLEEIIRIKNQPTMGSASESQPNDKKSFIIENFMQNAGKPIGDQTKHEILIKEGSNTSSPSMPRNTDTELGDPDMREKIIDTMYRVWSEITDINGGGLSFIRAFEEKSEELKIMFLKQWVKNLYVWGMHELECEIENPTIELSIPDRRRMVTEQIDQSITNVRKTMNLLKFPQNTIIPKVSYFLYTYKID